MDLKVERFDKELYKEIGKTLREARNNKGYSLRQVEMLIGNAKSHNMIKNYELGKTRIDNETMEILCNLYGISSNDLRAVATNSVSFDYDESKLATMLARRILFIANANNIDIMEVRNEDIEKILDYADLVIKARGK